MPIELDEPLTLFARYTRPPLPTPLHVTHPFGEERARGPHRGVDLRASVGTPAYAVARGTVARVDAVGADRSMGKWVVLALDDAHGGGEVVYVHLSRVDVERGQRVDAGQVIGATGDSPGGPHLHLEDQLENGAERDPVQYMRDEWFRGASSTALLVAAAVLGVGAAAAAAVVVWKRRRA